MEAVGNKIRLNSQSWEDLRVLNERQVFTVVVIKGQLYLLPEPRPAKFEHIDHDGLSEGGLRARRLRMSNRVASDFDGTGSRSTRLARLRKPSAGPTPEGGTIVKDFGRNRVARKMQTRGSFKIHVGK